ncbi:MAG: zinc ABC transporter substrate-binding protein [Elioraea sp.]|nr:zinc ABC transporter substrate-binding protein [Elioraea sp.]
MPKLAVSRRALFATLAAWTSGIGAASAQSGRRVHVVATTAMIGDLVSAIAAERAGLHVMMGPGVDPHLYRATRSDLERLLRADLVLANGLGLEGRLAETFARVARAGRSVLAVAETLPEQELIAVADAPGAFDPHVWMDPGLWLKAAEAVAEALIRLDPAAEASFRRNLDALKADLAALDRYAASAIATIPANARVLITAHDAFAYFGRRYGLAVEGIQGLSTETEAGLRRIGDLVELVVTRRIPAVFAETSVPDRNLRALVEGAAARGHRVVLGGTLFSDSMGEPGTYEGTYLGMLDHNVTTIVRALGGTAPERGFAGRLAVRR